MNVLILGNGGREATIAWKVAQSPLVTSVHLVNHPAACTLSPKITSHDSDLEQILTQNFDLAIIGPENLLGDGLADSLRAHGIPTVGPSKLAAQLELSKSFAKDVMKEANVPTAQSATFTSQEVAIAFLELCSWDGVVVKADGPAQGKGVVVCESKQQALETIVSMMSGAYLGVPVEKIVLEEKISGPEISVFALCSGEQFVRMSCARDHKRLLDGDLGPNTGGMGTVSPVELSSEEDRLIDEQILAPVLKIMKERGLPFNGFLFAGLMRTSQGLKVLEFNTRLGDPETQVLLPRMTSDFVPALLACAQNDLSQVKFEFDPATFVHVVMAAPGYPGTEGMKVQLGHKINWKKSTQENSWVFPAGLTQKDNTWVSRGGRILGVTAKGASIEEAREEALNIMKQYAFIGAQWRRDIGVLK